MPDLPSFADLPDALAETPEFAETVSRLEQSDCPICSCPVDKPGHYCPAHFSYLSLRFRLGAQPHEYHGSPSQIMKHLRYVESFYQEFGRA